MQAITVTILLMPYRYYCYYFIGVRYGFKVVNR